MNISKQLSMLPTYEGLNGQSVIGQGLIVKFTMEPIVMFLKIVEYFGIILSHRFNGVRKQLCLPNYNL